MTDSVPETVFEEHLSSSAMRYFPDLAGSDITVSFTGKQKLSHSTLYRFQVGNVSTRYPIIIKVRDLLPASAKAGHQQYVSDGDSIATYHLEYRALKVIHSHFSALNDPRFGTVRPLDLLDDQRAIIMTESLDRDMRWLFLRQNRLSRLRYSNNLDTAFRNAGAWLCHFHQIPQEDYVKEKYASFEDYKHYIEGKVEFLIEHTDYKAHLERVMTFIGTQSQPKPLPLARGHNDFSLRNILLGPNARVTVIDSIAKWQTAIYEDIGYFLIRLYTNQAQVFTQQLAISPQWIARCEQNFLESYFTSEIIPYRVIALYKLTALLDQWAWIVGFVTRHKSLKNIIRLHLMNRLSRTLANDLINIQ